MYRITMGIRASRAMVALAATIALSLLAGAVMAAPVPTPTPAATPTPALCTSTSACNCGDTIAGHLTMTSDLSCSGPGLALASGAVLDCAGHTITGPGGDNSQFGIYFFQATGAIARNCRVTGFRRGVRIDQGSGNRVENVEAFGNGDPVSHRQGGYGFDLGSSTDNVIDGCNAHDNADEGIHIGAGSDRTTVQNSSAKFNYREQLYVFSNTGAVLTGNQLQGSQQTSSAALFMKDVTGARVSQSGIWNGNLEIRGASTNNLVEDTLQISSGIRFQADGSDVPTGNTVARSQVNLAFECVRSNSATGNTVLDADFQSCTHPVVETGSTSQPAATTLLGSRLPPGALNLDTNSTLRIGWHLTLLAVDRLRQPVAGADVTIVNRQGLQEFHGQTAADGTVGPVDLVSLEIHGAKRSTLGPHRVSITKAGVGTVTRNVSLQRDKSVRLALR